MLEIRVLGQFELQYDGQLIVVPSRPAQSLFAYLAFNAGITHRRERLAGMLWPDSTETNARSYLRHALWRIRRALDIDSITWRDYLHADDIAISFLQDATYWLDADAMLRSATAEWSVEDLANTAELYQGELLPGFYEEWTVLERERLRASFDQKMRLLLERQIKDREWDAVLEWGERWIARGLVPDAAYRALLLAHAGLGDTAGIVAVYRRYTDALEEELGLEPTAEMRELYEGLARGGKIPISSHAPVVPGGPEVAEDPPAPGDPPFKGLQHFDVADADLYFGQEALIARIARHLAGGHGLAIVVGASGSGKSSLLRAGLVPALLAAEPLADATYPP
jgi:DNA-binding SARP family transcriptional activator